MKKKGKPRGTPFTKKIHHENNENFKSPDPGQENLAAAAADKRPVGRPKGVNAETSALGELLVPHSTTGPFTRLRAQKMKSEEDENFKRNEYFLCHRDSMQDLINNALKGHIAQSPSCTGDLKLEKYSQFGVSSVWQLCCNTCDFVSLRQKMYIEEERLGPGVRGSSLNRSVGTAIAGTPIGPTVMSEILMKIGVDPGSLKSLSENHNKGCDKIVKEVEAHLEETRKERLSGPRSLKTDSQYPTRPGAIDTPKQSSNQAVTSTKDSETGLVVHVVTANKLCRRMSTMMINGEKPDCPDHADGSKCTANLRMNKAIGDEGERFRETVKVLRKDGVEVQYVTADGDSKLGPVIQEEYGSKVEHFRDTRHFSAAIKKAVANAKFSQKMFKAKKKVDRTSMQKRFAEDVRRRISFEFKTAVKATEKMPDDEKKSEMFALLTNKPKIIVKCLNGDHSECDAFICEKWHKGRRLQNTRLYKMTKSDRQKLHVIIERRLGEDGISKTWRNENTQACEALHRMYSKSCSKNVTYIRNYRARILSSVLVNNIGFDGSTALILQSIGHSICGNVMRKIKLREKQRQYHLAYQKLAKVKKRRIKKRDANWIIHAIHGEQGNLYDKGVDL